MNHDRVIRLCNQYAELYYGDFSITAQIRLSEELLELVEAGEITEQDLATEVRYLQNNPTT